MAQREECVGGVRTRTKTGGSGGQTAEMEEQRGRAIRAKVHFKQFILGINKTHTHTIRHTHFSAPSSGEKQHGSVLTGGGL